MFDPHRKNSVFYCSVNELALIVFLNNLGVAERESVSFHCKGLKRVNNFQPPYSDLHPDLHFCQSFASD